MNELNINVKGMMCEGCEKRVQNTLKQIDGVTNVAANYKDGKVTISLEKEVDINTIKSKIEDIGYEVLT